MRILFVSVLVVLAGIAGACGGTAGNYAIDPFDAGNGSSSGASGTDGSPLDSTTSSEASSSGNDGSTVDGQVDGGPDASDASDATDARDASDDAMDAADAADVRDAGQDVDAGPIVTLTLNKVGGGPGTVAWSPGTTTCGPGCTTLSTTHTPGSNVTLTATTANGSDAMFVGFTGGTCTGLSRACALTLSADVTITARFIAQPANLVFASSVSYATNLGGTDPYDKACNDLASTAGINNSTSSGFVAWVSTNASSAKDRLGMARGFVRMDAKAFADTQGTLLATDAKIFYPIIHDENGVAHSGGAVMTGTRYDGTIAPPNCSDFSLLTGNVLSGELGGGPSDWTEEDVPSCANPHRILCLGTTMKVAVTPTPNLGGGKTIYVTNAAFQPSVTTPNARCTAAKPPSVGAVHAVVATSGASAASQLGAATLYIRPDGVVVGTGAQISALAELQAGFWQSGNSNYGPFSFWTGAATPAGLGTETCTDWTIPNPVANGRYGYSSRSVIAGTWAYGMLACDQPVRFLCVEN